LRDRPHAFIEVPFRFGVSRQSRITTRLSWLFGEMDREIDKVDAAHAGNAIISLDEPMGMLRGLHKDSDFEAVANGLFRPFDNGTQPNQRPSHLFIADTNHFALPLLLAAQSRAGKEARENAVLMQRDQAPYGGSSLSVELFTFRLLVLHSFCLQVRNSCRTPKPSSPAFSVESTDQVSPERLTACPI
jgi:hypothetical protein